ncbi:MAG: hypothetical protein AB7Q42_01080 [Acidimicrobiia bacterium]
MSLHDDPETNRILDLGLLITAGLLSFVVFARVPVHALSPGFQGEFRNHSLLVTSLESDGSTPYSLWYVLQKALVGGNRDELVLLNAGWLMLGALAAFKGIVLTGALLATSASRLQALIVGFLLGSAVAFPMPWLERRSRLREGPVNYLGTLPPNVFMSATQLMANIAAVVAVVTLTLWFQKPTSARFATMASSALLATLAKPGIAPALLATVALLTLLSVRARRQDVRTGVASLLIVGFLVGIPLLGAYSSFMTGRGRLGLHSELRPFDTWTTFTNQWFPDLIASWAFPIVVIGVLWVSRNASPTRREWLIPAWSMAAISTLMFALLAEVNREGKVIYAGNFAWGAMAATSGLYVVSAIALHGIPWRIRWMPLAVLTVQAITGLHYLNRYIDTGIFI